MLSSPKSNILLYHLHTVHAVSPCPTSSTSPPSPNPHRPPVAALPPSSTSPSPSLSGPSVPYGVAQWDVDGRAVCTCRWDGGAASLGGGTAGTAWGVISGEMRHAVTHLQVSSGRGMVLRCSGEAGRGGVSGKPGPGGRISVWVGL